MFIWPIHLFNPTEMSLRLVESVMSGGTSLSGIEDVISTDGGGPWEVVYGGITLRTPAQIRAWEAWEGFLARGKTDCYVPLLTLGHANRTSHGRELMGVSKLAANDPVFPTSLEYSLPPISAFTTAGAVPIRATTMQIFIGKGAPLAGGEKFSVYGRAYRIVRRIGPDIFQIEPPLRSGIDDDTALNFALPLLKCRSAPGESWSPTLTFGRRGEVSIRFLENAS